MRHPYATLAALCGALTCVQCTITRSIRPVGADNTSVGVSVGGPIFGNLGEPVPVPVTAVFATYGLTPRLDLEAGVYFPVIRATGFDIGAAYLLVFQNGIIPAVMVASRLMLIGNGRYFTGNVNPDTDMNFHLDAHLFEEADATASWQLHPDWLIWGGLDLFAQGERGTVRPSLKAGTQWRPTPAFGLTAEVKWESFLTDTHNLVVEYATLGGRGAVAVQLGGTFYFCKRDPS